MPHVLLGRGGAAPCIGCEAPCGVNSRGCVAKFRIPYDKCITRVHYSHFQYPYSQCQCQLFAAPVRLLGIIYTRVARIFQYHTSFLCRPRFFALPCAVSFAVASQPAHICAGTTPHLRRDRTASAPGLHQILVLRHVLPRAVEAAGRDRHKSCQSRGPSSPWATLRRRTSVSSRPNRSCAVVCA